MTHQIARSQVSLIKYKGLLDMDGLFDMIYKWMMVNQFTEFNEEVYKHKMPELERKWVGLKNRTEYVSEIFEFECHFWGVKPVEVVKDGHKKKMYNARGEMKFTYVIQTDWEGKWETSVFLLKLRNFFDSYVIKKKLIFEYIDPLEKKVIELASEVKRFLGMEGV
ncbi:MAG: hypothetical protein KJ574_02255 [Nanoarchaeota archaeon]|nr:hypothetical protein [Nanoarchaeota archaeon]